MTKNILQIKNVSKSFLQANQNIEVLKNINLEVNSGEVIALTGPSGSGKTTLLQITGLLDSPSSGTIIINNKDVSIIGDSERTEIRKAQIGFIYQFHHLIAEFSAIENVAIPLLINEKNKNYAFEQAKEILKEVELEDKLNYKPYQLSGGQQQRVAIARAIINKPSLILADEPTGNLDFELSEKIFEILYNLTKKYQIACLIVTHNQEISKKTDRIIKIKSGIIV
jgi:lipoprotein-releasing system ATP-binding protein